MTDYVYIRGDIALAISTAELPKNGLGEVFVNGFGAMSPIEFWENVLDEKQRKLHLLQAQAALDVMSEIGFKHLMLESCKAYIDEK